MVGPSVFFVQASASHVRVGRFLVGVRVRLSGVPVPRLQAPKFTTCPISKRTSSRVELGPTGPIQVFRLKAARSTSPSSATILAGLPSNAIGLV